MATNGTVALLRRGEDLPAATYLELLFDVGFVLALGILSGILVADLSWSGAVETLMLLLPLSLLWASVAGAVNRFDERRLPIQMLILGALLATLVMAAAAPEAFGQRGVYFAGAYVAVQVGGAVVLVFLARGQEVRRGHEVRRVEVRRAFWYSVSGVPWIAGALLMQGWARGALWALAVAVDFGAGELRLPVPGLGRLRVEEYELSGEHLAGRYRQFYVIALGEMILVIGLSFDGSGFGRGQVAAVLATFATTVLLWRIYIYRAGELMASALAPAPKPIRARPVVYAHLVMVAGAIAISVGFELVIGHPLGHTQPAWIAVILGGPALFLAGRALFDYVVFRHMSWHGLIGALVLAAMSPAMILVPPLVVTIAAALVLAGVAATDRGYPLKLPSPLG